MPEDEDRPEESKGLGRETVAMILSAVDAANERAAKAQDEAMGAVIESNKDSSQRMAVIVLLVLGLLAGAIGIGVSLEMPGVDVGVEP